MADRHAVEVTQLLRGLGVHARSDPTQQYATAGSLGRPDYQATYIHQSVKFNGRPGFAPFWIEVKAGGKSFMTRNADDTTGWTTRQREWASTFGAEDFLWFALMIGVGSPSKKHQPRCFYLVPYAAWKATIEEVEQFQNTLPHYLTNQHKLALRERGLSASSQFKQFALTWVGTKAYKECGYGPWVLGRHHPFYQEIVAPDKLPQEVGYGRYFFQTRNS